MDNELSSSVDEDVVHKIGESKTSNVTSASAAKINLSYYNEGVEGSLSDHPLCSTTINKHKADT